MEALLFDLLRLHDFTPRRERERFLERERERFLERELERFLEQERFLEPDRFDRDLLLPLRERFLERERDRVLPPLEHDLFLDRDLDRLLPEKKTQDFGRLWFRRLTRRKKGFKCRVCQ